MKINSKPLFLPSKKGLSKEDVVPPPPLSKERPPPPPAAAAAREGAVVFRFQHSWAATPVGKRAQAES